MSANRHLCERSVTVVHCIHHAGIAMAIEGVKETCRKFFLSEALRLW